MTFHCHQCNEIFSRKQYLVNHINQVHNGHTRKPNVQSLLHTLELTTNLPIITKNGITRIVPKRAFNNLVREIVFYIQDGTDIMIPCQFFDTARQLLLDTIEILKSENRQMKVVSTVCVRFVKQSNTDMMDNAFFSYKAVPLIDYELESVFNSLLIKIDNYETRGSNWKLQTTNFFRLCVNLLTK